MLSLQSQNYLTGNLSWYLIQLIKILFQKKRTTCNPALDSIQWKPSRAARAHWTCLDLFPYVADLEESMGRSDQCSLGREPQKSLWQGLCFFCIFEKSGQNEAIDLAISQLRGSTIAIISSHVPGQHIGASAGCCPNSSSLKQWKSDGSVKIYNSVSTWLPLTKSKKIFFREGNNIKS